LQVCQVNVNAEAHLQIVCGAKNVAVGMKVPTAIVGAKLPGDFKIKKAKLRGVPSFGMLCASSELGLSESSEGLMPLPSDAPIGRDFRAYLNLDDNCIEVDLTPNRGDCLSVRGVARELGVYYKLAVTEPAIVKADEVIDDVLPVSVVATNACPRYLGRVIKGINPIAETPFWMQEKLRRSGLRSISPTVDVTNFVLIELGQPMHAFDLTKISGGLTVRMAEPKEVVTLLDGQEKALNDDALVIADEQGAVALAGIMGGERTAVDDETTDIFLECAFFAPLAIVGRGRNYGIQTDSSHRFERGVDWQLQEQAIHRATELLLEIAGGQAAPVTTVESVSDLPEVAVVTLRKTKIQQILGLEVVEQDVTDMLTRLGMAVTFNSGAWQVTPPSYRFDIEIEADLIEEVARIYGYDNLPISKLQTPMGLHAIPEVKVGVSAMKNNLVGRGYQEVVTYSFVHPDQQAKVSPDEKAIALANPISADLSVMRTSLWTGLLQAMVYNRKRQQSKMRLFESGLSFVERDGEILQKNYLAGLVTGSFLSEQWGEVSRPIDFFDVKADVLAVLSLTADTLDFSFKVEPNPALHPGQSARIYLNDKAVGWIGMVHPKLEQEMSLGQKVFVYELDVSELSEGQLPKYKPLSKYPGIRRDIALIVKESVTFEEVQSIIKNNQSSHLKETILFDVYRGEHLGGNQKSLAIGLILQDETQTLKDEDVDISVGAIVKQLTDQLGATLRD